MAHPMRAKANASRDDKLRRLGLQVRTADEYDDRGEGHSGPAANGTQGKAEGGYADQYRAGDRVKSLVRQIELPDGKKAPKRLDRKAYAAGGSVKKSKGTTVNVIVAPGHAIASPGAPSLGGMSVPPAAMVPPPPSPQGVPVPPLPVGRKRGGRVKMTAGAGSGEGRLEKIASYGKKAK